MSDARILLAEDDRELLALVRRALEEEGFAVTCASTGSQVMACARREPPDALLIDVGLPDADGRDVCQALRAHGIRAPVLFLTARDALTDRLAGFAAGGDDYLIKPFSLSELVARLRAVLGRAGIDGTTATAGLTLDPTTYEAAGEGHTVRLTPTEFRLLGALATGAGESVRRRDLVGAAWPDGAIVSANTIDVYIARLRRKLRAIPGAPPITTVHGVGYRLR
jgi:two-component system response regulator MprA